MQLLCCCCFFVVFFVLFFVKGGYLFVLKIFIIILRYRCVHMNQHMQIRYLSHFERQRLRRACSYAQTRQCIYCSHTKCMCICRLIPKFRPLSSLETSAWCTASQRFFVLLPIPIYTEKLFISIYKMVTCCILICMEVLFFLF